MMLSMPSSGTQLGCFVRRLFDYRLYDVLEVGVEHFKGIQAFGAAAATVQVGNKVMVLLYIILPYKKVDSHLLNAEGLQKPVNTQGQ